MDKKVTVVKGTYEFNCKTRFVCHDNPERRSWYTLTSSFCIQKANAILAVCPSEYCAVYVNGEFAFRICERSYIFDPCFKVLDISGFVTPGNNTLTILYCSTGDKNRDGAAFEIRSEGRLILVSDENVLSGRYLPLSQGTPYLVEGGAKEETYDSRNELDIDDYADENVYIFGDSMLRHPFYSIHKSDLKLTDDSRSYPEYMLNTATLKSGNCFHKVLKPSDPDSSFGYYYAAVPEKVRIDFFSGVAEAYCGGKRIESGGYADSTGSLLCIKGNRPDICISGTKKDLVWRFSDCPQDFPKRPFFPWNDLKTKKEPDGKAVEISMGKLPDNGSRNVEELEPSYLSSLRTSLFVSDENETDFVTFCKTKKTINGKICEYLPITSLAHKETQVYLLDWNNEQIGSTCLDITAPSGYEIRLDFFESIKKEGASFMNERMTLKYISKGGRQTYYSHVRRGFRYALITLHACTDTVTIHSVSSLDMSYPIDRESSFNCSDERLNEIYRLCERTAECCTLDTYVDCPAYEQNPWTGDAYITSRINLNCFGEYEMNRSYHRLIAESIEDGLEKIYRTNNPRYVSRLNLPCACFPTYPEGTIPVWSLMWMMSVYDHYMYSGDSDFLNSLLPSIEESLRRCEVQLTDRNLLSIDGSWSLIEWSNNDILPCGEVTANSMMLSYVFSLYAYVEKELGRTDCGKHYTELSEKIKEALNRYCWDDEAKAYTDMARDEYGYRIYSEYFRKIGREPEAFEDYLKYKKISVQTNTYAVIFNIAEGERKQLSSRFAIDNISTGKYVAGTPANNIKGDFPEELAPDGYVHIGSPFFLHNAYTLLAGMGEYELILNSIRRDYGSMIDEDIKTATETFNKPGETNSRSYCHSWSAYPAAYFKTHVLGIRPVKPGFREFSITPHLCGLEYAEGSVPTPYGEIKVRISGKEFEYSCPKECTLVSAPC